MDLTPQRASKIPRRFSISPEPGYTVNPPLIHTCSLEGLLNSFGFNVFCAMVPCFWGIVGRL